jgi:hypothetical protein
VLVLDEGVVAALSTVVDDRLERWRAGFEEMFALSRAGSRRRGRGGADETGFVKKGTKSAGVNASTPAPPGRSRTASSGCS